MTQRSSVGSWDFFLFVYHHWSAAAADDYLSKGGNVHRQVHVEVLFFVTLVDHADLFLRLSGLPRHLVTGDEKSTITLTKLLISLSCGNFDHVSIQSLKKVYNKDSIVL